MIRVCTLVILGAITQPTVGFSNIVILIVSSIEFSYLDVLPNSKLLIYLKR